MNLNPSRAAFDAIVKFTATLPAFVPAPIVRPGKFDTVEAYWRHANASQVFSENGEPHADPLDLADRLIVYYRPKPIERHVYLLEPDVAHLKTEGEPKPAWYRAWTYGGPRTTRFKLTEDPE